MNIKIFSALSIFCSLSFVLPVAADLSPAGVDLSFAARADFGANGTTMLFVDRKDRIFQHPLMPFQQPLFRLNADGTDDPGYPSESAAGVYGVESSGEAYSISGFNLRRVLPDGTLDPAFVPPTDLFGRSGYNSLNLAAREPDGKIVLAASAGFNFNLRRLNPDGTRDFGFPEGSPGNVMVPGILLIPPDGRIIIWVAYSHVIGPMGNQLIILNPDGSSATAKKLFAYSLAVQQDGKILAGAADGSVARFGLDYNVDDSFRVATDGVVSALSVQTNGKILIGGNFTMVNGVSRKNLARINADGSLDPSFDVGTGFRNDPPGSPAVAIGAIALQSAGKILVAGRFTSVNGVGRTNLVRLNGGEAAGPPIIQRQPSDLAAEVGSAVSLVSLESGSPEPSYQWQFNGGDIPGATNSTLTLPSFRESDAGDYLLVASNSFGIATSRVARLTVLPSKPMVVTPPGNQSVTEGAPVAMSIAASGTAPLSFQWKFNDAFIPGANTASYNIPAAAVTNAGIYSVIVTNVAGAITNASVLTVTAAPHPPTADPLDTWTSIHSANASVKGSLYAGVFTNGIYVAVGDGGTILRSTDGVSWEKEDSDSSAVVFTDICYADGLFVAVGNTAASAFVVTSPDAIKWTRRYQWNNDSFSNGYFYLQGVIFAQGQFLGYGNDRSRFARWITSSDGTNWNPGNVMNFPSTLLVRKTVYARDAYHVFGATPIYVMTDLAVSTDLKQWSLYGNGAIYSDFAYGNGVFVFVSPTLIGTNGVAQNLTNAVGLSADGMNVVSRYAAIPNVRHITFGKGLFVASGLNGALATSVTGGDWKSRSSGTTAELYNAIFGQNDIIILGAGGTILKSGALTQLSAPTGSPGDFRFTVNGSAGDVYTIQKSGQSSGGWQDIGVLTNATGTVQFSDTFAGTNNKSMYRLLVR